MIMKLQLKNNILWLFEWVAALIFSICWCPVVASRSSLFSTGTQSRRATPLKRTSKFPLNLYLIVVLVLLHGARAFDGPGSMAHHRQFSAVSFHCNRTLLPCRDRISTHLPLRAVDPLAARGSPKIGRRFHFQSLQRAKQEEGGGLRESKHPPASFPPPVLFFRGALDV